MFAPRTVSRLLGPSVRCGAPRRSAPVFGIRLLSLRGSPQQTGFYSSKSIPEPPVGENASVDLSKAKRSSRSPAAKTSLRRAAVEAQLSKDGRRRPHPSEEPLAQTKMVTAYAVAEQFDIGKVMKILLAKGYEPDPFETGLYPQVIHVQVPLDSIRRTTSLAASDLPADQVGDVFIFPSGTVVSWSLPEGFTSYLASTVLLPAAENPHIADMETEHLEYSEDPQRDSSTMKGDKIILGTKPTLENNRHEYNRSERQSVDTVFTKIAFSSGLARSTKLAVLESLLSNYFDSTRNIPTLLSKGTRLPYSRGFILRKTGQLLSLRAQLNLYSELTDSLPDLFWDSKHELGLEGNYDQVGRALDVGIRIKILNEKMDYAQEIASVLRERLSETHGLRLEWTIILLIAVEVGFEVLRLWKEKKQEEAEEKKASA
ncbi:hypothetical protein D8B26_003306 [Coccidioides posadasii str. Silveira]|uniref:YagE family protein n=3 Tax=Coccidioides posadasii TaxID=199306 RepID=E9D031_COCPS|nr:hypothetical protein CPC735_005030 [Coccidioides posadasii C735 delta SOWgp]EER26331.1 hypothetical protein CPC735_005030 [Coccidioides posadasii C735 delta SOWgp]EFW20284.1 YagE family protein [Coccidioides posadasii str. Silveira]KMM73153.1 cytoplasm protein [Coccidioides posadasii RMSCC 3488]QVM08624.1 hypothetical protein D8B26_003306 [Coccidioides posadasii str. Silveira]|eukprot:XP_003068476.1 hypothetical protein CPC735_005030 [Coccidioides posadasii C735 delta SOWgp]